MSFEPNPNFSYGGGEIIGAPTYIPTTGSEIVGIPDVAGPPARSRIPKIIIIVVLVILIITSIVLIIIFRSNLNTAENNENPSCPILICPTGQFGVVPDPDCGGSAFRFRPNGTKMCSTTRYAPQ